MHNDYPQKKILILDAYSRQTLPLVRGFKKIGQHVTVVGFSKLDIGLASNLPDRKIKLKCDKEDYEKQYELYTKLIKTGKFDLVVPTTDYSAIFLSDNKKELNEYAEISVNDKETFGLAIDKNKTMQVCAKHNIPAPRTIFTDDPIDIISKGEINYPIVVKPQTACGSVGFTIVDNENQLKDTLSKFEKKHGKLVVQEYIPSDGPQYGSEVFRTKEGKYGFVLIYQKLRWFPLDGGSSTINITVHDDEMVKSTKELLEAMDFYGYANIDFMIDSRDGKAKIIEINARPSAVMSIDELAGINVAKYMYEDAFGTVTELDKDYEDGLRTSCFLTETLWFMKSKDRFASKPSMFNRKNTKDVIFNIRDIKPSVTFCIQSAKNFRHAMDERKRN